MIKIGQKINSHYKSINNCKSDSHQNSKKYNVYSQDVFIKNTSGVFKSDTKNIPLSQNIFLNFTGRKKGKSKITPECFFIRMKGYRKNYDWAEKMVEATHKVSDMIKSKTHFFDLLDCYICERISEINHSFLFGEKRTANSGYFRGAMMKKGDDCWKGSIEYFNKYKQKLQGIDSNDNPRFVPKSNQNYPEANVCRITYEDNVFSGIDKNKIIIHYGWIDDDYNFIENSNLKLCQKAYTELLSKENPTEKEILETCATIQWLIAQECPFKRGNDSIANLLAKSIMHCYNLRISPIKEGVSLDFEAFYSNLDDYIKNYPNFFEKYPKKLDK